MIARESRQRHAVNIASRNASDCADHCAADQSDHVRSYSINHYLDGEHAGNIWPFVVSIHMIANPAKTVAFLEEFDPRGYNEGGFVIPQNPADDGGARDHGPAPCAGMRTA